MVVIIKRFITSHWRSYLWGGVCATERLQICTPWSVPRNTKWVWTCYYLATLTPEQPNWQIISKVTSSFLIFWGDLSREREETFRNFETADIPLERNSVDLNTNAYGYQLTDFCKNNSVFILNGRLDCHEPKLTCKNSSTVDYFVSSAFNFGLLSSLTTHEFDALFSDAHCPVSLTLIPINKYDQPKLREYRETEPNIRMWNTEKTESFCRNINYGEILK